MAEKAIFTLLCGLMVLAVASAQTPGLGKCPTNIEVKTGFKPKQYLGLWYEYARSLAFEGTCVTVNYTANPDGSIKVENRNIQRLTQKPGGIVGTATLDSNNGEAKLTVKFPQSGLMPAVSGPYWVLDTDYKNFAVIWSCSDIKIAKARTAWILTRARFPEKDVLEKAYAVLDNRKIGRNFVNPINQKDCPEGYDKPRTQ